MTRQPAAAVVGEPMPAHAPTPPVVADAPVLGPAPKPRLSVQQVAAWLRQQHGSERASQMLYGRTQRKSGLGSVVANAAERKAAIKRLAPGESQLPEAARQAMSEKLAELSSPEAGAYAGRAPNALAEGYFGDLLRQALRERMLGQ